MNGGTEESLVRASSSTDVRRFSPQKTCVGLSAWRVLIHVPFQEQLHALHSFAVEILV